MHGPDFNVCLALLREPAAILQDIDSDDESFIQTMPFLQRLHDLVRACQFSKFWAEFNGKTEAATLLRTSPNYFPAHKDLVPKLRFQFASSIAASFSRVRLAQLSRWLDLDEKSLAGWCKEAGWEIEGDVAVVPKNGDNDVKAGVVKENVQLKRELGEGCRADFCRAYQACRPGGLLGIDHASRVHIPRRGYSKDRYLDDKRHSKDTDLRYLARSCTGATKRNARRGHSCNQHREEEVH